MSSISMRGVLRTCACRCAEFLHDLTSVNEHSMHSVSAQIDELLRIFATLLKGTYPEPPAMYMPDLPSALVRLGDALDVLRRACDPFIAAYASQWDASARAKAAIVHASIDLNNVASDLEGIKCYLDHLLGLYGDDEAANRSQYLILFGAYVKSIDDAARTSVEIMDAMAAASTERHQELITKASSLAPDEENPMAESTRTLHAQNELDSPHKQVESKQESPNQSFTETAVPHEDTQDDERPGGTGPDSGIVEEKNFDTQLARLREKNKAVEAQLIAVLADSVRLNENWHAMVTDCDSQRVQLQEENRAMKSEAAAAAAIEQFQQHNQWHAATFHLQDVQAAQFHNQYQSANFGLAMANVEAWKRDDANREVMYRYERRLASLQKENNDLKDEIDRYEAKIASLDDEVAIHRSIRRQTDHGHGSEGRSIDGMEVPTAAHPIARGDGVTDSQDDYVQKRTNQEGLCCNIPTHELTDEIAELTTILTPTSTGDSGEVVCHHHPLKSGSGSGSAQSLMDLDASPDRITAIFTSLSSETIEEAERELLRLAKRSENEIDGITLRLVGQGLFEAACRDTEQSALYARLYNHIYTGICSSNNTCGLSISDEAGKLVAGGLLFDRQVLGRCQAEFELGAHSQLSLDSQLGLPRFLGELFNIGRLPDWLVHQCITELMDFTKEPFDFNVARLFQLLRTVGRDLDAKQDHAMIDAYSEHLRVAVESPPRRIGHSLLECFLAMRNTQWRLTLSEADATHLLQPVKEAIALSVSKIADKENSGSTSSMPSPKDDSSETTANRVEAQSTTQVIAEFGQQARETDAESRNEEIQDVGECLARLNVEVAGPCWIATSVEDDGDDI